MLPVSRERVAGWYSHWLAAVEGVQTPWNGRGVTRMSGFVTVVRLAPGLDQTTIIERLAERVARTTLALPFSGRMTEGQVARVGGALVEVIGE